MRLYRLILLVIITLSSFGGAHGQLCGISSYPYGFGGQNYPRMQGAQFKSISGDLPFVAEDDRKPRYSQFWVNTDVLNIRSGPGLEYQVISETYYGNLVFALAKKTNWVAISKGYSSGDVSVQPRWVNIKYLSANKIRDQVDAMTLKGRCSFIEQSELNTKELHSDYQSNRYNSCHAVRRYLTEQRMLSKYHSYYDQYAAWRNLQRNPENYNSLPCAR